MLAAMVSPDAQEIISTLVNRVIMSADYGAGAVSQIPGNILTHPVGEADLVANLEFCLHLVSFLIPLEC